MSVLTGVKSVIHYTDHGAGQPVLFIHGWLMSRNIWRHQLALGGEMRLISIDLCGHGESATTDFSYANCLDDIISLLDFLSLERVTVVGWSMGSQIALRLYERSPERLCGMILVAATPCFCRQAGFEHGLMPVEVRSMQQRLKRDYHRAADEFCRLMFFSDELTAAESADLVSAIRAELPDPAVSLAALQELASHDLRDILPFVHLPVLLVHGTRDRICPVGAAAFLQAVLPSARAVTLEDTGHAPLLTRVRNFNSMISEFVKESDAAH
jgi:pimeloyl-[acyl-carrier protein] methyl ester esterase